MQPMYLHKIFSLKWHSNSLELWETGTGAHHGRFLRGSRAMQSSLGSKSRPLVLAACSTLWYTMTHSGCRHTHTQTVQFVTFRGTWFPRLFHIHRLHLMAWWVADGCMSFDIMDWTVRRIGFCPQMCTVSGTFLKLICTYVYLYVLIYVHNQLIRSKTYCSNWIQRRLGTKENCLRYFPYLMLQCTHLASEPGCC